VEIVSEPWQFFVFWWTNSGWSTETREEASLNAVRFIVLVVIQLSVAASDTFASEDAVPLSENAAGETSLLAVASDTATSSAPETPSAPDEDHRFFQDQVLPILQQRCYECHSHSGGQAKGGLMLDSRESWKIGGDSGPAIVPGDLDNSPLVKAVHYDGLMMPPTGRLPDEEIAVLVRWVKSGAYDPRVAVLTPEQKTIDFESGRKHWAFQPLQDPIPPQTVKLADWPINETDRFILAKMEENQRTPVSDADRSVWLRRVTLDLTGLPPTPEDIEAFLRDDREAAYEHVVDRLLESVQFGERWARHWLDLVGYADQIGTANNIFAEHAWRYRDYVIRAFHEDRPFDQLIREQIAGDLLESDSPEKRADQLVATGYLLLGDLQVVEADKAKLRVDVIDQQIDKLGKSLFAMSLSCARCHDHKFDPISRDDYYALAGMFYSTESVTLAEWGVWSWPAMAELPETAEQIAARQLSYADMLARVDSLKAERDAKQKEKAALENPVDVAAPAENAPAGNTGSENTVSADGSERSALTKEQREQRLRELGEQLKKLDRDILHGEFFLPKEPEVFAVRDIPKPEDMRTTIRGNAHSLGDTVPRGLPTVLIRADAPKLEIPAGRSGRRELADWIVSSQNPVTPRVLVNRIWQKLFGEGLVRSLDYWGTRGDQPSHPELLDFLARRFVNDGWSQKRLIRHLVLSRTYRLSSQPAASSGDSPHSADPENRFLSRMNRWRLDAEAIRDSMLFASGRLMNLNGGASLPLEYPENTGGLAKGDVNPPSFRLAKFRPEQSYVRTVYLPVIRSGPQAGPAEIRNVFDFTQPAEFSGRRTVTAVPTQSLFLMNSQIMNELAGHLTDRILKDTSLADDDARLNRLWMLTLNRPMTQEDRDDARLFLDESTVALRETASHPSESSDSTASRNQDRSVSESSSGEARKAVSRETSRTKSWEELCHALLASNEFLMRM
jgi:hypothetical protein